MFKVQPKNTVKRRIEVIFPADGEGYESAGSFVAELKLLREERMEALADAPFIELVEEALVSVAEVGDADGNELPPEQARAAVLDTPQAVSAIAKEIYEINRGRPFAGADSPRDRKPGRRR